MAKDLRKVILRLARGNPGAETINQTRSPKVFPIEARHVGKRIREPAAFHRALCEQIRQAERRVHIASLYIGPAVDRKKYALENEFLQALSEVRPAVDITILLDKHRALRPVPISNTGKSTSSAEACFSCLKKDAKIYLLPVLDGTLMKRLPNPLNEIAGVFHMKIYIVDDEIFLSGANLSQEYFSDRHDRYLRLRYGANGLVDMYSELVLALCKYGSQRYGSSNDVGSAEPQESENRHILFDSLLKILTTQTKDPCDMHETASNALAYAIPTLQVPTDYFRSIDPEKVKQLPTDKDTIHGLLRQVGSIDNYYFDARVASAYLNPTESFLDATKQMRVHFLTAGSLSHGFRPKNITGNQSRSGWISAVFENFVASLPRHAKVWHYQREDWTFHAKGIWLTYGKDGHTDTLEIPSQSKLVLATHGSGNNGWRSEIRDMESNLILVFPKENDFSREHVEEWNQMVGIYADQPNPPPRLPPYLSWALPVIKTFF